MSKFVLKKIDTIKGKLTIYKLIINGECEYDDFFESLESGNDNKTIGSLTATLNSVSNLNYMPFTRYRELKGRTKNDKIKDYEAKSGGHRLYLFKHESGKIVAFGGIKADQENDIKRLRRLKLEFHKSYKL
ncbi:hypothetical protein ACFLS4_03865 [Bacteroidota bacterium]